MYHATLNLLNYNDNHSFTLVSIPLSNINFINLKPSKLILHK